MAITDAELAAGASVTAGAAWAGTSVPAFAPVLSTIAAHGAAASGAAGLGGSIAASIAAAPALVPLLPVITIGGAVYAIWRLSKAGG